MQFPATALGNVDGWLMLQLPWGLAMWPDPTNAHEPGAVGHLLIEPGDAGDTAVQCRVTQHRQLALLECNSFQMAVLLPPGVFLPQRAGLALRMPTVEVDEGVLEPNNPAEGECSCPPCAPVSPAELRRLVESNQCPL